MERHASDPVSLAFGVVFIAAGAMVLVDRVDLLSRLRWAGPVLIIAVALGMLAATIPAVRQRSSSEDPPAAD